MSLVHLYGNPVVNGLKSWDNDFNVMGWTHRHAATIGFDTARFTVKDEIYVLEDLFANGLTARVTRYAPDDGHIVIWEGFVSEMTLTLPGMQIKVSLRDMYNRVYIRYVPTDTSTNPPTYSAEASTSVVNNAASQAKYGIKEISFRPRLEQLSTANAAQMANTVLAEYREPRKSPSVQSSTNDIGLEVVCQGYMHTLEWRLYNQTSVSGAQDANLEITDIVAACGQYIKSTILTSNGSAQVQKYFGDDRIAYDLVRSIAGLGDGSYNRWIANVFENRILSYKPAATAIAYTRSVHDGRQEFFDLQGRRVPYYEIRPDNWLRTVDVYPHQLNPASLKDDPQAGYIESVQWDEDDDRISIEGSTGDDPRVFIARVSSGADMLL